jgi:cell division topological specificity factor
MFGFMLRPRKANTANTAQTAKDRLQILLAHERSDGTKPDFLPSLQREILEVIKRHMEIDSKDVDIKLERDDEFSSIEINIELPAAAKPRPAGAA